MYEYSACSQIWPSSSLNMVSPSHPLNSPEIVLSIAGEQSDTPLLIVGVGVLVEPFRAITNDVSA
jgi:hypothetical protein